MPARPHARLVALVTAWVAAAGLAACSAKSDGSGAPGSSDVGVGQATNTSSASGNPCSPSTLRTRTSGTLTIATDSPAYSPWFVDDKPSNGKGYESAVGFAIGKQLGYPADKVTWTVAAFNSVIAPTPKQFDFDLNQVSITSQRAQVVDFSTGYYDVKQSVVMLDADKYAKATSIAGLKGASLGAQQGTTSLGVIDDVLKTGRTAREYPTNDLAVQALKNGQIDGLVVDLPTGLYITAAELKNAKIVGQLADSGTPEQFGAVLEKGSRLTTCVSKAVYVLSHNGTLAALEKRWLTTSAGAPELK